ncbi:MAG: hypothetical protein R3Y35_09250 [Clostridia bacterium]
MKDDKIVEQSSKEFFKYLARNKEMTNKIDAKIKKNSRISKKEMRSFNDVFSRIKNNNIEVLMIFLNHKMNNHLAGYFYYSACELNNISQEQEYDYDDISKQINKENILGYLGYFILKKDEISCGKLNKLINNGFIDKEYTLTKTSKKIESEAKIEESENLDMKKYIGVICLEERSSARFFNFYPYYKVDDNKIENVIDEFPENGNLNLYNTEYNHPLDNEDIKNNIYVLEINENLLEDNINTKDGTLNRTNKKLYINKIIDEIRDNNYNDYDIYKIVTPKDINFDINNLNNYIIEIYEENLHEGEKVLLKSNDIIYGPFEVNKRANSSYVDTYYININEDSKYCVKVFENINLDRDIMYLKTNPYERYSNNIITVECIKVDVNNCTYKDIMHDDILIKEFKKSIQENFIVDNKLNLERIEDVLNWFSNNNSFVGAATSIKEERILKIKNILDNISTSNNEMNEISDLLLTLISKYSNQDDSPFKKIILDLYDEGRLDNLQNFKIINNKLRELENEYNEKEQSLKDLNLQIKKIQESKEELEQESYDRVLSVKKYELEKIINETSEKEEILNKLKLEVKENQDKNQIYDSLERLNSELEYQERSSNEKIEKYKADAQKYEDAFNNLIDENSKKVLDLAYDETITNKIFDSVNMKLNTQETENLNNVIVQLKEIPKSPLEDAELINYLVCSVQKYRKYSKNNILNIFICISQGFLTVFSGEPGTGKTSICKIISKILSLNNIDKRISDNKSMRVNRFINVSVERGWTSKRDFIGYFNPLTKKFENNNKDLFDALSIQSAELDYGNTDMPMFILLDEANLSPMEYYWADFMNNCDDLDSDSCVILNDDVKFKISSQLRFMATINNDHTTEVLSPRLIDRSWILNLPNVDLMSKDNLKDNELDYELLSLEKIKNVFICNKQEDMDNVTKEIYDNVLNICRKNRVNISNRNKIAMENYWSIAKGIFEKENGVDNTIIALDYAVSQKVLPKINGTGENYKKFLTELSDLFKKQNMAKCIKIINDILESENSGLGYYQFFR